ncbi:MAG: beta-lactamase family protein [Bacteroidales bacterium]|nr:beta-lactamase family protein [Bacteroidales bacterium]
MKIIKRHKEIIWLLAIVIVSVLCIRTWGIGQNSRNKGSHMRDEQTPTPLNHLITNSMSDSAQTKKFDAAIERFMRYWGIKGGSFALMRNDSLIYAKGYGYACIEDSTLCEVKHIFRIASVSKLITAVAIMRLCETGQLTPQSQVFGECGILNDTLFLKYRDKKITKVTVEHLLRHLGGFSNPHGDAAFNRDLVARWMDKELPLSMDDMVEYATKIRLRARPGDWFDYSNLGYIVLSKVIEKVSGMPYHKYVKDSVLAPAGCYDIHLAENYCCGLRDNEVNYYEVKEAEPVPAYDGCDSLVMKSLGGNDVHGLYGAGGWVASPVELLKFVAAINEHPGIESFLSRESIEFMTPLSKDQRPAGWSSITSREWQRTGSMSGTSAMVKAYKVKKKTAASADDKYDHYCWVFISNSSSWNGPQLARQMNRSITRAMERVKEWPKVNFFELEEQI